MARIFQESDFVDGNQQAAQPAATGRVFTEADFAADGGEFLPDYANGLTPLTAMNTSPLSLEERAALSVGNEAGKMKFLKERFKEVQKTKSGDVIVNDGGFWKRIDPEGLGAGDAWSQTKELLADAIDLAPTAINIGAQLGAAAGAAALTSGASLTTQAGISASVGAALKAGETSLGRLVGTYEATPEEQMKDIGLEGLLNIGGTYVAAGVKPAVGMIADGLAKTGKLLGDIPAQSKQALLEGWANITGVGAKNLQTLMDNPTAVSTVMKKAAAKGEADVVGSLIRENIADVKSISTAARSAVSNYYDTLADDVVKNVPENFMSNVSSSVREAYSALVNAGVGTIDDAGKFTLYDKKQLANMLSQQGEISPLLTDDKSYKIINELVDELSPYMNSKILRGKAGAHQLMQFRKTIGDFTYRLKEEADEAFLAPAQRILAQVNDAIDNNVIRSFDLKTPVKSSVTGRETNNLLAHANESYKSILNQMEPLLKTARQGMKQNSDAPYETLYNQLGALQGKNEVKKSAFDAALDVIGNYGGAAGKAISQKNKDIVLRQAAAAFTPAFKQGLISQGASTYGVGSVISGNLAGAGLAAATAGATSPRLQKAVVTGALQFKNLLGSLAPAQKMQLLNDPQALGGAIGQIMSIPQVQTQVTNQLMQQGIQAAQGGQ